ncbi:hypothetical protein BT96DRAFT_917216 [Gymnopus androsaceus JB14]|uniref:Uncharacterized protein n=1 Tax=Gymnopus androsaceus JB14 TaxID=1447944 RepID=A0A6A4HZ57_9AGAR|nr:hypothetical protein BT96DRAFT_917216 [Gymnopus androsaceus JB14]
MSYGCCVGKGWKPFIHELCVQLTELDAGVEFSQIKEKFGRMRIYNGFGQTLTGQEPTQWQRDQADKLIQETIRKADASCETCGAPGILRTKGWYNTACDEHKRD